MAVVSAQPRQDQAFFFCHLLHPAPAQVCILLHGFAGALLQGVHILKPALLPVTAVVSLQAVHCSNPKAVAGRRPWHPCSQQPGNLWRPVRWPRVSGSSGTVTSPAAGCVQALARTRRRELHMPYLAPPSPLPPSEPVHGVSSTVLRKLCSSLEAA